MLGGGAPDPLGELEAGCGFALDDDGELVAADAEGLFAGTAVLGERARELAQHAVAGRMALVVVQPLEVVEVEEDERQPAAGGVRAEERTVDVLLEGAVVAELGQRVGPGLGMRLGEPARIGERGTRELGRGHEEAGMDAERGAGRDAD